ncbi:hypothetical protein K435DRAFT_782816 [Dendrothele bispora CBS 962.96]|uniref:Uncharacterized protein n=1 Tax=Dendrothele bispora (strain CBS 962.96) TaxID=1314807 RepID=A0A4S8LCF8_DENBC|nr:hypothetical protein K435DRAFT_782816 [Dendrothele bispora CBS 962.96]
MGRAVAERFISNLFPFKCSITDFLWPRRPNRLSLSDLPLELLLEIFEFATYVHESRNIMPLNPFTPKYVSVNVMGPNTPTSAIRTKCALVLVSHSWRRIALHLLYRHVHIRSPNRAKLLLRILQPDSDMSPPNTSERGQFTRYVEVSTHVRGSDTLQFLQTVFGILQCCPNVQILSGTWEHALPDAFLAALTRLNGSSLHALYWGGPGSSVPVTFFSSFQALRALDIDNVESCPSFVQNSLPLVQDLKVSNLDNSLQLAASLKLPALRNLLFKSGRSVSQDALKTFLEIHGPFLLSVDVLIRYPDTEHLHSTPQHTNPAALFLDHRHCPNLQTFTFDGRTSPFDHPVDCPVRTIGLRGIRASDLYPNNEKNSNVRYHLESLIGDSYPFLETVRAVEFLVESDSDDLAKDVFIWWTERFERRGVDFQDAGGVVWAYADDSDNKQGDLETVPWDRDSRRNGIVETTQTILSRLVHAYACKV